MQYIKIKLNSNKHKKAKTFNFFKNSMMLQIQLVINNFIIFKKYSFIKKIDRSFARPCCYLLTRCEFQTLHLQYRCFNTPSIDLFTISHLYIVYCLWIVDLMTNFEVSTSVAVCLRQAPHQRRIDPGRQSNPGRFCRCIFEMPKLAGQY